MKFTLAQLRKMSFPYSYDEEIDLSLELNGFEDIISSKPVKVHSTIVERGIDTYLVNLDIHSELTLEDSVSLEAVPYTIDLSVSEIFTTDSSYEDAFLIDGITLDTKEAIITNILINKPMSYTTCEFESDTDDDEDDGEYINPAFAGLKDLL